VIRKLSTIVVTLTIGGTDRRVQCEIASGGIRRNTIPVIMTFRGYANSRATLPFRGELATIVISLTERLTRRRVRGDQITYREIWIGTISIFEAKRDIAFLGCFITPNGTIFATLRSKNGGELNTVGVTCAVGHTSRYISTRVTNGGSVVHAVPVGKTIRVDTLPSFRQSGGGRHTPNFFIESVTVIVASTSGVTSVGEGSS